MRFINLMSDWVLVIIVHQDKLIENESKAKFLYIMKFIYKVFIVLVNCNNPGHIIIISHIIITILAEKTCTSL